MKNLLTKTLFISLLMSATHVVQTDQDVSKKRQKINTVALTTGLAVAKAKLGKKDSSKRNEYEIYADLEKAVESGHLAKLECLIAEWEGIDGPGWRRHDWRRSEEDGLYLIERASYHRHAEIFAYLAQQEGIDASRVVTRVAEAGNLSQLQFLITRGINLDSKDPRGFIPLEAAVVRGYMDVAKLLVENGADINAQNRYGFTPLHVAVNAALEKKERKMLRKKPVVDFVDMIKFFIEKKANPHIPNHRGETAFTAAKDDVSIQQMMITDTE